MTIPFDLEGEAWEVKAIVIVPEPAPLLKVSYEPVALGAAWHFHDPDSPLAPARLEVTVGPRMEEPSRVEWNGEHLVVINLDHRGQATRIEKEPSDFEWRAFVRRLDELDAWSWRSSYQPAEDVRDGYEWSALVEIGGRRLASRGYMAYPGGRGRETWDAFLLAVESLVGEPLH